MTLLEYYKKKLGDEVVSIDELYININMVPDKSDRLLEKATGKAGSNEDEFAELDWSDDFSYWDDCFEVVTFKNGEKKYYLVDSALIDGAGRENLKEETDIIKWVQCGKLTYDIGNRELDETEEYQG